MALCVESARTQTHYITKATQHMQIVWRSIATRVVVVAVHHQRHATRRKHAPVLQCVQTIANARVLDLHYSSANKYRTVARGGLTATLHTHSKVKSYVRRVREPLALDPLARRARARSVFVSAFAVRLQTCADTHSHTCNVRVMRVCVCARIFDHN